MREKLKSIMHSRDLETLEKFIDMHSLIQQFPFFKKKRLLQRHTGKSTKVVALGLLLHIVHNTKNHKKFTPSLDILLH